MVLAAHHARWGKHSTGGFRPKSAADAFSIAARARHQSRRDGAARLRAAHPTVLQSGGLGVGQLFGHLDQKLTRLAALDLVEGLHDADRTGGLREAEEASRAGVQVARRAA